MGMKTFTALVERDPVTGLLVGYVPGFPGAHSQAGTLDELQGNLRSLRLNGSPLFSCLSRLPYSPCPSAATS